MSISFHPMVDSFERIRSAELGPSITKHKDMMRQNPFGRWSRGSFGEATITMITIRGLFSQPFIVRSDSQEPFRVTLLVCYIAGFDKDKDKEAGTFPRL